MISRIASHKEERDSKQEQVEHLQEEIQALIQKDEDDTEKDKFHDEEMVRLKDMIEEFKKEINTFLQSS